MMSAVIAYLIIGFIFLLWAHLDAEHPNSLSMHLWIAFLCVGAWPLILGFKSRSYEAHEKDKYNGSKN